jgi:hypothetical protein
MRIILFLISIFLGLCLLLLITDRGILISEEKDYVRIECKYFSGRNIFITGGSFWDGNRRHCAFISKPK